MKKVKIFVPQSVYSSNLFSFVILLCFLTASPSQLVAQQNVGTEPTFKIYTDEGEVDFKEGISADTKQLFIQATSDESDLAYRVASCEVTLVSGGLGLGSVRSTATIDLEKFLAEYELKDGVGVLAIKIIEYQSKNAVNEVETFKPKKNRFYNIPVKKAKGK
ncbi:MAG: hypothetical protein RIM99_01970 [Cyclobacteriaceae bacterium]